MSDMFSAIAHLEGDIWVLWCADTYLREKPWEIKWMELHGWSRTQVVGALGHICRWEAPNEEAALAYNRHREEIYQPSI